MTQARAWAAVAYTSLVLSRRRWIVISGQLEARKPPGCSEHVVAFAAGQPGPVRATHEAGLTVICARAQVASTSRQKACVWISVPSLAPCAAPFL
jgi:hypothetical protein